MKKLSLFLSENESYSVHVYSELLPEMNTRNKKNPLLYDE